MKESVIYQEITASAEEKGRLQGRLEGKQEGEVHLVLRQLNRRLGQVSESVSEQIYQLPLEQIEDLGEALLDFESEEDLLTWLAQ